MNPMDLGVLADLLKEMGKGGGGSTEEPTVCFVLVPIGLGVLAIGFQRLKQGILRAPGGRTAALGVAKAPERKVQTA